VVFLNSLSEVTFLQNNLPSGQVNNTNSVQCNLYVSDSLASITIATGKVNVIPKITNNLFSVIFSSNSFLKKKLSVINSRALSSYLSLSTKSISEIKSLKESCEKQPSYLSKASSASASITGAAAGGDNKRSLRTSDIRK
jgi:hypothetical protein